MLYTNIKKQTFPSTDSIPLNFRFSKFPAANPDQETEEQPVNEPDLSQRSNPSSV